MNSTRRAKASIPSAIRWRVWKRDDFTCIYCGSREFLAVDHAVPESRDGPTVPENLATVCGTCNSSKGTMSHDEFMNPENDTVWLWEKDFGYGRQQYPKRLADLTLPEPWQLLFSLQGKPRRFHRYYRSLVRMFPKELRRLIWFRIPPAPMNQPRFR